MNVLRHWQLPFTFALLALIGMSRTDAAADELAATVERRVRDWQPTKDERLLDQVGWASNLVEGRRLANKHQRPLFVFTYDGSATRANAIALQRC